MNNTEPNRMISVSFFQKTDKIKICCVFEYQSNENRAFRFFRDTRYRFWDTSEGVTVIISTLCNPSAKNTYPFHPYTSPLGSVNDVSSSLPLKVVKGCLTPSYPQTSNCNVIEIGITLMRIERINMLLLELTINHRLSCNLTTVWPWFLRAIIFFVVV